jgi:hypothetical protein
MFADPLALHLEFLTASVSMNRRARMPPTEVWVSLSFG